MNKIETMIQSVEVKEVTYVPRIYLTAWGKWCVSYSNEFNPVQHLCSVVVQPEYKPTKIEDTIGYLNEYVGNTRTLDDAVDMIIEYIKKNYIN